MRIAIEHLTPTCDDRPEVGDRFEVRPVRRGDQFILELSAELLRSDLAIRRIEGEPARPPRVDRPRPELERDSFRPPPSIKRDDRDKNPKKEEKKRGKNG